MCTYLLGQHNLINLEHHNLIYLGHHNLCQTVEVMSMSLCLQHHLPIKSNAVFSSCSLAQKSTSGFENIYDPEKAANDIMGMVESEEDEGATFRMKALSQSKKRVAQQIRILNLEQ